MKVVTLETPGLWSSWTAHNGRSDPISDDLDGNIAVHWLLSLHVKFSSGLHSHVGITRSRTHPSSSYFAVARPSTALPMPSYRLWQGSSHCMSLMWARRRTTHSRGPCQRLRSLPRIHSVVFLAICTSPLWAVYRCLDAFRFDIQSPIWQQLTGK